MKSQRNNISASRIELIVEVDAEEMKDYSIKAANKLSEQTTIEGFRPGKAPFEMVKARVGDMIILEEASRIAVRKTIDQVMREHVTEEWVGHPEITISKLAPDNPFEYRALITLLPKVELGNYKDLNISLEDVVATDEEVEKMIVQLREMRGKEVVIDRASITGDKMVVDVNLFLDKVPLEGGQAKELAIILGKDYFVPGFDERITGMKAGEQRDFFLVYPTDHHQKNLAGKKVEFTVKAKQVYNRELPEVDSEFVSAFGLKDVEELKTNIKKSIEDEKRQEAHNKFERAMVEKIISNSTISEIPDTLVNDEIHIMFHELEHNIIRSGGKFDDYLQSIGKTKAQLMEELRPQATERVKAALVLRAVIEKEGITVSDEAVAKEIETIKKQYSQRPDVVEQLNSENYKRHISNVLLNRQILEKLAIWNSSKNSNKTI